MTRWNLYRCKARDRVGRRFRGHVRSPSNPRGRIRREPCQFCGCAPYAPGLAEMTATTRRDVLVEGAHVDYARPFAVLWACRSCHRKLEWGTLHWRDADVHDYSSLVITHEGRWASSPLRPRAFDGPRTARKAPAPPAPPAPDEVEQRLESIDRMLHEGHSE